MQLMGLFIGIVYWFLRYIALCLLSLGNSDWIVFYSGSNKRNPIYSYKNILFFYNLASNTDRCICSIYCINYYSYSQSLRLKITTNKICTLIEHSSATHFSVYTTNVWQIELSRVIKQGRLFLKYIWYHVEYLVLKYLKVTPTRPRIQYMLLHNVNYCTSGIGFLINRDQTVCSDTPQYGRIWARMMNWEWNSAPNKLEIWLKF